LLLFDHQTGGFVLRQRRMRLEQQKQEQEARASDEQET